MSTFKVKNLKNKKGGRPSIFIGSSTESLPLARAVKAMFPADAYEVDIWDEDIFDPNIQQGASAYGIGGVAHDKGKAALVAAPETATDGDTRPPTNLDSLKNFSDIYDFAIFVFVPDDKIVSQTRMHLRTGDPLAGTGARHNLVFEFGLFLGRIGSKKTFVLADRHIAEFITNFFTDLKGISLCYYESSYESWLKAGRPPEVEPFDRASLEEQVAAIQASIAETNLGIELGFLPSTALAIGYFENMLRKAVLSIHKIRSAVAPAEKIQIEVQDKEGKLEFVNLEINQRHVAFKVVIPNKLLGASHEKYKKRITKMGLLRVLVPFETRPFSIFYSPEALKNDGALLIYDIPSTMFSSSKAIGMLTAVEDIRELLDEKEKQNFKKALMHLINKDKKAAVLRGLVEVVGIREVG